MVRPRALCPLELRRYLDCGILAFDFERVHCWICGEDELVTFLYKGRGSCPSYCGRGMANTTAHLRGQMLPQVPVCEWVLSLPFRTRCLLAHGARLGSAARRNLVCSILDSLRERAAAAGVAGGR